MKPKQLILLLIILVLLGGLILLKTVHRSRSIEKEVETKLNLVTDPAKVQKVEFSKDEKNKIELVRQGGDWRIPGLWNAKADSAKVNHLFDFLSSADGELRANNADVLADFNALDKDCFSLVLMDGSKELLHLFLSAKLPEHGGTFMRLKGSNSIYLLTENLFNLMGFFGDPKTIEIKADSWADLSFFSIDASKIKLFIAKQFDQGKEKEILHLERKAEEANSGKEERWLLVGEPVPFGVGLEKVYRFFEQLKSAYASKLMDPGGNYGFDTLDAEMDVTLLDNSQKAFKVKHVKEKDSEHYLIQTDDKSIFFIPQNIYHLFQAGPIDFLTATPISEKVSDWLSLRVKTSSGALHFIPETAADGKIVWKIEGKEGVTDQVKILDYLNHFEQFSIDHFSKESDQKNVPKDMGSVWFEIEFKSKELVRIEMSSEANPQGFHAALRQGFPHVFYISKSVYDFLNQPPAAALEEKKPSPAQL